jgi:hypothetical protein
LIFIQGKDILQPEFICAMLIALFISPETDNKLYLPN